MVSAVLRASAGPLPCYWHESALLTAATGLAKDGWLLELARVDVPVPMTTNGLDGSVPHSYGCCVGLSCASPNAIALGITCRLRDLSYRVTPVWLALSMAEALLSPYMLFELLMVSTLELTARSPRTVANRGGRWSRLFTATLMLLKESPLPLDPMCPVPTMIRAKGLATSRLADVLTLVVESVRCALLLARMANWLLADRRMVTGLVRNSGSRADVVLLQILRYRGSCGLVASWRSRLSRDGRLDGAHGVMSDGRVNLLSRVLGVFRVEVSWPTLPRCVDGAFT